MEAIERENFIDVARGIGLYLVILGHLVMASSSVFKYIFSFHMPLFFFLSGYCFSTARHKFILNFQKNKLLTFIRQYLFFASIGLFFTLIVPVWRKALTIEAFSQIFYRFQPEQLHVGQLWFLSALFFAQIIFFAIHKIIPENKWHFVVLVCFAMTLVGQFIHHIGLISFKVDSALITVAFFCAGFYIKQLRILQYIYKKKWLYTTSLVTALVTSLMVGVYLNGGVNICNCKCSNLIYFYIAAFAGILAVSLLSMLIQNSKYLAYYGKNSLPIFATHSLLLYLGAAILSTINGTEYVIMKNIPLGSAIILSIIIYVLLFPVSVSYSYCSKHFSIH